MKTVVLVREGELAGYPADILVEGEVRKSYNLEFECEKTGAKMVIAKSMPSSLIKKLRDKNIIPIHINNTTLAPFFTNHLFLPKYRQVKEGERR